MSNSLYDKQIIHKQTGSNNSKGSNKIYFLKKILKTFHDKITSSTNDFSVLEKNLIEWIKKTNKNTLKLMQDHNESEFWFSSIIGFFYQYGIRCDVDKDKALKSYLLAVNNEESLNQNLEKDKNNDGKEFETLQNINM